MTVAAPSKSLIDLDSSYRLTPEQIESFRTEGFIKLKNVLSAETLAHYGAEISRQVQQLNKMHLPMEKRTTYQKAFLQVMNIWTKSEIVKEFVFSKRLAKIASDLMGTRGVRLYHDQALYKEKGGGLTPWHADQFYWPLANNNTVTAWIPLQKTSMEMGPLAFAARSQHFTFGRDLEISEQSERQLTEALNNQQFQLLDEPFDLGEVSYHSGWTFHRAGPNTTDRAREVMTIIYMDKDIRVLEPQRQAHRSDLKDWLPGATIGEVPNTPLNPVLWTSDL